MVLVDGSVWNIMFVYMYDCCSEVYFYFDVFVEQGVMYFMGCLIEIWYFWMNDWEVVILLFWLIYVGFGMVSYFFIWVMVGENKDFIDMDFFELKDMW